MGRLADLNQLNNLSGMLDIEVRRESKYIALSEISATNLNMKENLRELNIRFKNGTKEDKRVLECLKPPYNLKILDIDGLPHLEDLFLSGLDEVEYVADNENELSQAPLFPSQIHLQVSGMPKLKGWWGMTSSKQDSKEDIQLHVQVQHQRLVNWKPAFPKLGELDVDNVELAITITRQQIGGFTSLKKLCICDLSFGEQSHQQQAYTLPFSSCFPNLIENLWIRKYQRNTRMD
uniref:R13L1/DRL21-like LRR repeat region domain-containing protein n=1 Tax=Chenopodium quinoa TaxID=63459 RepID=A0A803MJG6_CHEQI